MRLTKGDGALLVTAIQTHIAEIRTWKGRRLKYDLPHEQSMLCAEEDHAQVQRYTALRERIKAQL